MYSMAPKQVMMPVSPVGGYHLDGAVGGFKVSFLVDTGAAVTARTHGIECAESPLPQTCHLVQPLD